MIRSVIVIGLVASATASAADEKKSQGKPKKVAILGTGLGAVSTAWYLTDYEGWQDDWDVTVYTLGFKMGGKAAATRSMGYEGSWIREHGLHIMMGWYNNVFKWVQDMYAQWKPEPDCPLQKWTDAFKLSCNAGIYINRTGNPHKGNRPDFIPMGAPGGSIAPGTCGKIEDFRPESGPAPSPWALFKEFLPRIQAVFEHRSEDFAAFISSVEAMSGPPEGAEAEALLQKALFLQTHVSGAKMPPPESVDGAHYGTEPTPADLAVLGQRFACAGMGLIVGTIRDGVLTHGFQVINHLNANDWLKQNGCAEPLGKNPLTRLGGDLTFAYENGVPDDEHFNSAAGTSLAGIMLVAHAFPLKKGSKYFSSATFLRMQAGMSETFVTPAYEVLKRRGVKFHFFHKVEEMLTNDGTTVDEIRMRVQATVKGGKDKYNPFYKVQGLPVTPDLEVPSKCVVPACDDFFSQLEEADEIRQRDINLNSYYGGWVTNAKNISLKRGLDYDVIVNGITAGIVHVSKDLAAKNADFAAFVKTTKTDSTQSAQVWFYNTTNELGCTGTQAGCSGEPGYSGAEATLTGGSEPFDTWADMSHLLSKETTNISYTGGEPKSVQYFCSPNPFDTTNHDFSDKSVIDNAFEYVFNGTVEKLEKHMQAIFPNAYKDGHTIYDWMVAPPSAKGRDRLRYQYWRSNADPSEQYVLSPAGSIHLRPSAVGPGVLGKGGVIVGNAFKNMIVVGDIARTGVDSGCAEAAVTSGVMASYALTGGRSPKNYTSWLSEMNRTDSMHLEHHATSSDFVIHAPFATVLV